MENVFYPDEKIKRRVPRILFAGLALVIMVMLSEYAAVFLQVISLAFPGIEDSFFYEILNALLSELFMMLPPVLIVLQLTKKRYDIMETVRLKKKLNFLQIVFVVLIGIGSIYLLNGISYFIQLGLKAFGYVSMEEAGMGMTMPDNALQALYMALIVGVLPAVCEELLFRGLILRAFERYSTFAAIFVSALLFGLMHRNLDQLPFTFLLGILLGVVAVYSDSLIAPMILHFTNNFIAVIVNYISSLADTGATEEVLPVNETFAVVQQIINGAAILVPAMLLFIAFSRRRNQNKYGAALPEELMPGFADKVMLADYGVRIKSRIGKRPFLELLPIIGFCVYSVYCIVIITLTTCGTIK